MSKETKPRNRRRSLLQCEALECRQVLNGSSELTARSFLVGFERGASPNSIQMEAIAKAGGSIVEENASGARLVELKPGVDRSMAMFQLTKIPGIRYVEPNRVGSWTGSGFDPSLPRPKGPLYKLLYGLNNSVEGPNGLEPVDINAPEAWKLVGDQRDSVIIGVLDSGIDTFHPDLKANLWTNPGEIPNNGIDDEGDGFVDDVYGWNSAENSSDILDDIGHGTFVSGVAAAPFDSGSGIVGADYKAKILSVKVGRDAPTLDGVVQGINFAVNHGARVINLSLTIGPDPSEALLEALEYARSRNVVVVVAAGNSGVNLDEIPAYPASYHLPNMLVVGAVDVRGQLADFSNFGTKTVDVVAPGVDIFSTIPTGSSSQWRYTPNDTFQGRTNYAMASGTSFSSPYAAGVVSLLISSNSKLENTEAVAIIKQTSRGLLSLSETVQTGGVVNAQAAVQALLGQQTIVPRQTQTPVPQQLAKKFIAPTVKKMSQSARLLAKISANKTGRWVKNLTGLKKPKALHR